MFRVEWWSSRIPRAPVSGKTTLATLGRGLRQEVSRDIRSRDVTNCFTALHTKLGKLCRRTKERKRQTDRARSQTRVNIVLVDGLVDIFRGYLCLFDVRRFVTRSVRRRNRDSSQMKLLPRARQTHGGDWHLTTCTLFPSRTRVTVCHPF